ncbi:MAG: class I SAM-dependent methyltransferase [Verrucomicrobia bacterium]|nr:MAG: class I SAM-dependent methyltransferase [Verrucomicrobiota bacterium]
MNWDAIDWSSLERLRAAFLSGTAGVNDYWQSESDLASYDATFAQRIGWKWDYVLAELQRRGWTPPTGERLDWGCGSGVAGRAFLDFFPAEAGASVWLFDRSSVATQFAARRAREKYPNLRVNIGLSENPSVLLISHVLTELSPEQTEALANFAAQATTVLWVEPGTYEASLTLIAIRERLRGRFNVVAPCTHQARCGILSPENERHWCHHFAAPPAEIFQDGNWSRFANLTGIDLRDLPLSFLVLDKRPVPPMPAGATRVIGHPRIYKAYARLLGCDESGVRDCRLTQRALPGEFKRLKKGDGDPLQLWQRDGDEILNVAPLE